MTGRGAFWAALGAALLLWGCASSPERYRDALAKLTEDLSQQLEVQTDLREMRLLVYEFEACESPDGERRRLGDGHTESHFRRRLRHQLMSLLARRLPVVETPTGTVGGGGEWAEGEAGTHDFAEAKQAGATAVLVGNYTVVGEDQILLMARVVDVATRRILAAADQLVEGVDVPHHHR